MWVLIACLSAALILTWKQQERQLTDSNGFHPDWQDQTVVLGHLLVFPRCNVWVFSEFMLYLFCFGFVTKSAIVEMCFCMNCSSFFPSLSFWISYMKNVVGDLVHKVLALQFK